MAEAQELVTITVGGKKVKVPETTSTTEIRTLTGLDRGYVLAQNTGSANKVVYGELKVREGDNFVVGRSFTKGSMDDSRLQKELERLSQFFQLHTDQRNNWVLIKDYGLPDGFSSPTTDILFNVSGFPFIPPAGIFGVYIDTGLTYKGQRMPNYYEALTREMFGRKWAWYCTGHMSWDPKKDDILTFLVTLDMMFGDPLSESMGEIK